MYNLKKKQLDCYIALNFLPSMTNSLREADLNIDGLHV